MKSSIRHGAVLKCDMVTVSEDGTEHTCKCVGTFITYSLSSMLREQAKNVGWTRTRVGLVKWPGQPPARNSYKVDLCPDHAGMVMSDEEAKAAKEKAKAERKAKRDAERKQAREDAKAEKKRQRDEKREIAKTFKEKKKARKKKAKAVADVGF